jgi:hypothetical protein
MFSLMYNQNHCDKTFSFKSNENKKKSEKEDTSLLLDRDVLKPETSEKSFLDVLKPETIQTKFSQAGN